MDLVRAVRHPARDSGVRQLRCRQARSAARHPVRHASGVCIVGRRREPLDGQHVGWRHHRQALRDGHRLPVSPEGARCARRRPFSRRGVHDRKLAARGRRLHRQARCRDRHRLVWHPVDPHHRRAGSAAHRLPAHAQLLDSGPSRPHRRGPTGRIPQGPRRISGRGKGLADRCAVCANLRDQRARGQPRRAHRGVRRDMGARRTGPLVALQRSRHQRRGERHDAAVHPRQDSRHRRRSHRRRDAVSDQPLLRHQAAVSRHRVLRDLQPRQCAAHQSAARSDRHHHRDRHRHE